MPLDERTPFFVSYRRADAQDGNGNDAAAPDDSVQQFHAKLCKDVGQLIALPRGHDLGFLDLEGLRGGTNWHPELLRALGSCQVLVALLSVPYLESEWCGKEWHAFASRRKKLLRNSEPNQNNIVPVRWAPIPEGWKLPAVISDNAQIFSPKSTTKNPDLAQRYSKDGIYHLMEVDEDSAVSEIVWQLAKLIQQVYYDQHLGIRRFKPDHLIDVFKKGQT